jgi:hypothetical protein
LGYVPVFALVDFTAVNAGGNPLSS